MQTLTLNGGTAAAACSEAAAARTIDGVDILEAEPPAAAAPEAADEPSSPTASQRESAKPSVQTRLGWALNRPGLMWVLIAGRVAADTDRTVEEQTMDKRDADIPFLLVKDVDEAWEGAVRKHKHVVSVYKWDPDAKTERKTKAAAKKEKEAKAQKRVANDAKLLAML